jgi:hypothetical protein
MCVSYLKVQKYLLVPLYYFAIIFVNHFCVRFQYLLLRQAGVFTRYSKKVMMSFFNERVM